MRYSNRETTKQFHMVPRQPVKATGAMEIPSCCPEIIDSEKAVPTKTKIILKMRPLWSMSCDG